MEHCHINDNNVDAPCKPGDPKVSARSQWRPEEDCKLRQLVVLHGPHNWNLIAAELQGRSGKSCRLRWVNQLDPGINRSKFSEEEDEKLMAAHRLYGNRWAMIASFFPGRTDNAIKNHCHVLMARNGREQQGACRKSKVNFQFGQRRLKPEGTVKSNCTCGSSNASDKTRFFSNASGPDEDPSRFDPSSASDWRTSRVSTPESSSVVTENRESSCSTIDPSPPFIDFLGVGGETPREV